jgi:hypothetical protein
VCVCDYGWGLFQGYYSVEAFVRCGLETGNACQQLHGMVGES